MDQRLGNIKDTIDRENGLSMEELEKITKERQLTTLEKIIEKNRKISKYISYYGQLLSKVDENLQ